MMLTAIQLASRSVEEDIRVPVAIMALAQKDGIALQRAVNSHRVVSRQLSG